MKKLDFLDEFRMADAVVSLAQIISEYGWDEFQYCLNKYFADCIDYDNHSVICLLYSKLKGGNQNEK